MPRAISTAWPKPNIHIMSRKVTKHPDHTALASTWTPVGGFRFSVWRSEIAVNPSHFLLERQFLLVSIRLSVPL